MLSLDKLNIGSDNTRIIPTSRFELDVEFDDPSYDLKPKGANGEVK